MSALGMGDCLGGWRGDALSPSVASEQSSCMQAACTASSVSSAWAINRHSVTLSQTVLPHIVLCWWINWNLERWYLLGLCLGCVLGAPCLWQLCPWHCLATWRHLCCLHCGSCWWAPSMCQEGAQGHHRPFWQHVEVGQGRGQGEPWGWWILSAVWEQRECERWLETNHADQWDSSPPP